MREKEFNLLYEPWILVLNSQGEIEEVSLLTAFERAHELRGLAGELPTQDVAILRLLLAVLYATFTRADIHGNQKAINDYYEALERWDSLWKLKRFPLEPIERRLCYYEERFYLFHPERPFYQIAGLDRGTSYSTAKLLGNLSESGNKVRLFPVRTGEAKRSISYPEAARWLLYVNSFDDTSSKPSVRGKNMPSPGAGWLGKLGLIYAAGKNLFETLMLNFVLVNDNDEPWLSGLASWELDKPRAKERTEIPLPLSPLPLLTIHSRRLLLQRDSSGVTGYLLLGGDFFPRENSFTEQMTVWRKDEKNNIFLPRRHDPSRQMWRDLSAVLAGEGNSRKPGIVHWLSILKEKKLIDDMATIALQIAGVKYGDKDFFVTDVFEDSISVNANIFTQLGANWVTRISHLLQLTDNCIQQLSHLARDLAKASGDSDSKNHSAGAAVGNAAKAEAYFRLDMPFRSWLAQIDPTQTDYDEVEQEWKETLKEILLQFGEELTEQTGEKGIVGRWVKEKDTERLYTAPMALAKFRSRIIKTIEKGG